AEEPDPLPLPVASAPPRMLPSAVEPALEHAMMGDISSAPPDDVPAVPKWAALVPRRRWTAAAAAAVIIIAGALLLPHLLAKRPAPDPAPTAATAPQIAGGLSPPTPPSKLAQHAASPWAKNFERAQKALWTNRPAGAQTILNDILRKPGLTRRDRARASKMMGDALAKKGNRAAATEWWRQSFQLYDDAEDRANVARLIQARRP